MAQHRSRLVRFVPALLTAFLVLVAVASPAAHAAPAQDVTDPPAELLGLEVAQASGNGCSAANTQIAVHPDNSAFDLWIDGFEARKGSGTAPIDFRKACTLSATATIPAGYSYGIAEISHSGRTSLPTGLTAQHRSSFYWCGCSGPPFDFTANFRGLSSDSWARTDTPEWIRFSPCSTRTEQVNIRQEVRIGSGTPVPVDAVSRLSLGSGPEQPIATYRVVWRTCA